MLSRLALVFVGLLGGVAVGVQSPIAGAMGQRVGSIASSFIIHLGGALLSGALLLLLGGEQIRAWRSLSWYMLGAGAFGPVLYLTLSQTFPRLGAAAAITLIIFGQLVTGLIIDRFGLFGGNAHPFSVARIAGVGVLLLGSYLVVR